MSLTGDATILVPVDVSVADTPEQEMLELLSPVDVVVLGYYPVPDQTPPAQLKTDHESDAEDRLEDVVAAFDRDVRQVLVFTHDRDKTIDRVAEEHSCDAVFLPNGFTGSSRVFVTLRGTENLDRILSLVAVLLRREEATATLFHAVDTDGRDGGQSLLDDAANRLVDSGVGRDRIDTRLSTTGDVERAILEAAREFDIVVVGETKPSLTDRILGRVPSRIVDEVDRPAFVVRGP